MGAARLFFLGRILTPRGADLESGGSAPTHCRARENTALAGGVGNGANYVHAWIVSSYCRQSFLPYYIMLLRDAVAMASAVFVTILDAQFIICVPSCASRSAAHNLCVARFFSGSSNASSTLENRIRA